MYDDYDYDDYDYGGYDYDASDLLDAADEYYEEVMAETPEKLAEEYGQPADADLYHKIWDELIEVKDRICDLAKAAGIQLLEQGTDSEILFSQLMAREDRGDIDENTRIRIGSALRRLHTLERKEHSLGSELGFCEPPSSPYDYEDEDDE